MQLRASHLNKGPQAQGGPGATTGVTSYTTGVTALQSDCNTGIRETTRLVSKCLNCPPERKLNLERLWRSVAVYFTKASCSTRVQPHATRFKLVRDLPVGKPARQVSPSDGRLQPQLQKPRAALRRTHSVISPKGLLSHGEWIARSRLPGRPSTERSMVTDRVITTVPRA